jgi:hypothetical protein
MDENEIKEATHVLWREVGRPECAMPSATQLVEFMRRAADPVAESYARGLLGLIEKFTHQI